MESSDIEKEFVVLSPEKHATPMLNTPDVYQKLDEAFGGFAGHELISCHSFTSNWPTWEVHPKGDEIVMLLAGDVTFLLDIEGEYQKVRLSRVGEYAVVPKGIWHTAHVKEFAKVLFITPGEGTQNEQR